MTYGIACTAGGDDTASCHELPDFDPSGDGGDFLDSLENLEGGTREEENSRKRRRRKAKGVGVAVATRLSVSAGETTRKRAMRFALCWDQPEIKFASCGRTWRRWYSRLGGKKKPAALQKKKVSDKLH